MELKSAVLDAVLATRLTFEEYFDRFRSSQVYFVAAFLDPTSKSDCFDELATEQEREFHYLMRCCCMIKAAPACTELKSEKTESHKICKIPKRDKCRRQVVHPSVTKWASVEKEWGSYKGESQLSTGASIELWYSWRLVYPNLFPLAVSIIYTKIKTCGMGRSRRLILNNYESLRSAELRRIMLVRDRFSNFGHLGKEEEVNVSRASQNINMGGETSNVTRDQIRRLSGESLRLYEDR